MDIIQENINSYYILTNSYLRYCKTLLDYSIKLIEINISNDSSNIVKSTDFFNGFMTGYKKAIDDAPKPTTFSKEPANFYL